MFAKKNGTKYKFHITFVSCSGVPDGTFLTLEWKRGTKAGNTGETKQKQAVGGEVTWNEPINLNCTLFKESSTSSKYDSKDIVYTLSEFDVKKKKDKALAKTTIDLAEFAELRGSSVTKYHTIKPKKSGSGGPYALVVTYSTEQAGAGDDGATSETDMDAPADLEKDDEDPFADNKQQTDSTTTTSTTAPVVSTEPSVTAATASSAPAPAAAAAAAPDSVEKKKKKEHHTHRSSTISEAATTSPVAATAVSVAADGDAAAALRKENDELKKERDELMKTMEVLSKRKKKEKDGEKSLKEENEKLAKELDQLKKQIAVTESEMGRMQSQSLLEAQDATSKQENLYEEIRQLKESVSAAEEAKQKLEQELGDAKQSLSSAAVSGQANKTEQNQEIASLKKQLEEQVAESKRLETTIKQQQEQLSKARESETKATDKVATTDTELQHAKQHIADLEKQIQTLQSGASAETQQAAKLEADLAASKAQQVTLEEQNGRLETRVKELQTEAKGLYKELQEQVDRSKAETNKHKDALEQFKIAAKTKLEEVVASKGESESEQLVVLQKQLKESESEVEQLKLMIGQQKVELTENATKVEETEQSKAAMEKNCQELMAQVAELEKKNETLAGRFAEGDEEKEELNQKLKEANDKVATLESLKETIEEQTQHLKMLEDEAEKLKKTSVEKTTNDAGEEEAKRERDQLRMELDEMKQRVEELEDEKAKTEKKLKEAEKAAAAAATVASTTAGDGEVVERLKDENKTLLTKVSLLEEKLEEMRETVSVAVAASKKKKKDADDSDGDSDEDSETSDEEDDEDAKPKKGKSQELTARINELETELASVKQRSSSAASSPSTLIQQLLKTVEELQFTPSGCPRTATFLLDQLTAAGALKAPEDASTYGDIVNAFSIVSKVHTDGYRLAWYWVSTAWWILKTVKESLKVATTDKQTICRPSEEEEQATGLVPTMIRVLYETFAGALGKAYKAIDAVVVSSMVETPSTATTTSTSPSAKTPAQVIAIVSDVMHAATEVKLAQPIRQQIVAQLAHCVNAGVFNALVTRPELCTCGSGMQIRLALSQLEDWLARDADSFAARKKLAHAREAANLFVMDKKILKDEEATKAAFSALNPAQIARLVESFHPDNLSKVAVDSGTLADVKKRVQTTGSSWETPVQVDSHAWQGL